MGDVDTQDLNEHEEEDIFLSDVIQDEHELLFLDSYLREAFRGRAAHGGGVGGGLFDEEGTI